MLALLFDDPAKAQGTNEEKWATFQRVRDEIGEENWLDRLTSFFHLSNDIYKLKSVYV